MADKTTEIVLEHLSVVRVQPGDTIVFRVSPDWRPSFEEYQRVVDETKGAFPDNRVLVLTGGTELAVIRPEAS